MKVKGPLRALLRSELPYIEMQSLEVLLKEYKNPRAQVAQWVKNGELLRLKNGFFLIKELMDKGIPFEQISNLLYGPSYVSLEYALAFYGMIPEAVYGCTAVTLGRVKQFHTPIGTFRYHHLSRERYEVGISHKENSLGGFSIATPEKALADHVFQMCQKMSKEELLTDLLESKRIELSTLKALDKKLVYEIALAYHSQAVQNLDKVISRL